MSLSLTLSVDLECVPALVLLEGDAFVTSEEVIAAPSAAAVDDCDAAFSWNHSWRDPFVMAGLSFLCPPLLCGCVHSFVPDVISLPSSSASPSASMALAVIARKLSTHPGTRFEARGVDTSGHAGTFCASLLLMRLLFPLLSLLLILLLLLLLLRFSDNSTVFSHVSSHLITLHLLQGMRLKSS